MEKLTRMYIRLRESSKGQTMAEYALIVALVAVVSVGAWSLLGTHITSTVNSIAGDI